MFERKVWYFNLLGLNIIKGAKYNLLYIQTPGIEYMCRVGNNINIKKVDFALDLFQNEIDKSLGTLDD